MLLKNYLVTIPKTYPGKKPKLEKVEKDIYSNSKCCTEPKYFKLFAENK